MKNYNLTKDKQQYLAKFGHKTNKKSRKQTETKFKKAGTNPPLASRLFGLRERLVTLCIESLEDARLCKNYRLAEINPFDCAYSPRGKKFLSENAFFLAEKEVVGKKTQKSEKGWKKEKSGKEGKITDSAAKGQNSGGKFKQKTIDKMSGFEPNGKNDAESDCIVIDWRRPEWSRLNSFWIFFVFVQISPFSVKLNWEKSWSFWLKFSTFCWIMVKFLWKKLNFSQDALKTKKIHWKLNKY